MYGCESWTIKKAEHRRIDTFELWCWRTLLRDPWTARRSNQSILKEINPECSSEGLMMKMKFWASDVKSLLIRKDPDVGKDRRKEKGMTEHETVGWHYWLNGHEFEQALGDGEGQGSLACGSPWGRRVGHWTTEQQHTCEPSHVQPQNIQLLDALRRIIASFTVKLVKSSSLSLKSAFRNSFLTFQVSSGCFLDNPKPRGAENKQRLPPDKWAMLDLSSLPQLFLTISHVLYAFKVRVPEAT